MCSSLEDGQSILYHAVSISNKELVKLLTERDINVNLQIEVTEKITKVTNQL